MTDEKRAAIRARLDGKQPYGPHPDGVSTVDDIRALLDENDTLRARVKALEDTAQKLDAALKKIIEYTPKERMKSPLTAMDGFYQIGKIARRALNDNKAPE